VVNLGRLVRLDTVLELVLVHRRRLTRGDVSEHSFMFYLVFHNDFNASANQQIADIRFTASAGPRRVSAVQSLAFVPEFWLELDPEFHALSLMGGGFGTLALPSARVTRPSPFATPISTTTTNTTLPI
jgi:hypothetical protein